MCSCHNTIQSASLFVYEGVEPYKTVFNFLNQSVSFIFETKIFTIRKNSKKKPPSTPPPTQRIVRLKISIYVCDSCLARYCSRCNRAIYLFWWNKMSIRSERQTRQTLAIYIGTTHRGIPVFTSTKNEREKSLKI